MFALRFFLAPCRLGGALFCFFSGQGQVRDILFHLDSAWGRSVSLRFGLGTLCLALFRLGMLCFALFRLGDTPSRFVSAWGRFVLVRFGLGALCFASIRLGDTPHSVSLRFGLGTLRFAWQVEWCRYCYCHCYCNCFCFCHCYCYFYCKRWSGFG